MQIMYGGISLKSKLCEYIITCQKRTVHIPFNNKYVVCHPANLSRRTGGNETEKDLLDLDMDEDGGGNTLPVPRQQ